MTSARFYAVEAWREFREGLRGPLVPLVFVGLVGYLLLVLLNAEYLRQMGATDVPRNSPHLVFLMTPGQGVWLLFAWAWVFAQIVTRDRAAGLHEVVLSTPVSLRILLVSRYVGALGVACLLGASTVAGFLLVPALSTVGLVPPEAVGPTPFMALGWAWLLFIVPSAVGVGALCLAAAIKTRSSAGPFAVAAALALVWMIAMVVLRGGDIDPEVATWLDPTGYAEAEEQTNRWTPSEKSTLLLSLTEPLVVNRVVWSLAPFAFLLPVVLRLRRERLVLERDGGSARLNYREVVQTSMGVESMQSLRAPTPVGRSAWWSVVLLEARWHVARSARSWGLGLAIGIMAVVGVAGSFVHVVAHGEGPLIPRAHLLAPFLVELSYVPIAFMIAGFVGTLARRDRRVGFDELVDATPAALGTRVVGRALAAGVLTMTLALIPTLSCWVVMGFAAPASFSLADPLLYNAFVSAPALLELGALTFLVHAFIRSSGAAYALSMMLTFVAIVNHELNVVSYPPAQVGIPVHVSLSELTGWSPWVAHILTAGGLKVAVAALGIALAWLAWPRGTALAMSDRFRAFGGRARGRAGLVVAGSVALLVAAALVYHDRLVTRGGFVSRAEEDRQNAAWEAHWWRRAGAFSVDGGTVDIEFRPTERLANVRWILENVRADNAELHGSLPHGLHIKRVEVDDVVAGFTVEHDHLAVELGDCAFRGCTVRLDMRVVADGWGHEAPPWLHESGVWARAADVLPRLGHDPERRVRTPKYRRALGLSEVLDPLPSAALVSTHAVAPQGNWHWSVQFAEEEAGALTPPEGRTSGPLDFAVAWRSEPAVRTERGGVVAVGGSMRGETAEAILEDLAVMRAGVSARLGAVPRIDTVLQAPRGLGATEVHGSVLWIPEQEGWDLGLTGLGRSFRREAIAEALGARVLADRADLRAEPGARWLVDGVAGWAALECIRETDGEEAWADVMQRRGDRTAEALGVLEAPVSGLASDGAADWVDAYAPLATLGWVETVGAPRARAVLDGLVDAVREGKPVLEGLAERVGGRAAGQLLGTPAASDVSVTLTDGGRLRIEGARWRWRSGGWSSVSESDRFVQLFDTGSETRSRLQGAPVTIDAPVESFTALDAWPSFERSLSDNIWKERRQ